MKVNRKSESSQMKLVHIQLIVSLALVAVLAQTLYCEPSLAVLEERSFQIIPGVRVGAITPRSTESELKKLYPNGSVASLDVDIGEGETEPGTVLFPNEPDMRLEILWKDRKNKQNPKRIQIGGEKTRWKTLEGISIGTTLKELERINAKPFQLAGFAWDYSGTVTSWKNGKLDQVLNRDGRVLLRLVPKNWNAVSTLERNSLIGDADHLSSEAAMQKLNPQVYAMVIEFN
jgi:hypothetical protein